MTVKVVRELGVKFKAVVDRSSFGQLNKRIASFRNATVGISLATAGVAFSISKLVNSTRAVGDMLDKAALRTGASTDALQRIGYAAELSGAGLESIINAMQELRKSVDDPGKLQFFGQLGISAHEASSDIVQLFERVREGLRESKRADFIGPQLLGGDFRALSPLIQATTADYEKMKAQAIIMNNLLVRQSAALTDLQSKMKGQFTGIRNIINARLLPAFSRLSATISLSLSTRATLNFADALGRLGAKELENIGGAFGFISRRIGDVGRVLGRLPAGSTGIIASLAGIATGVPGARLSLFAFLADDVLKLVGAIRLGGERIGETVIGSIYLAIKKLFTDFLSADNIVSKGLRAVYDGLTQVAGVIATAVNSIRSLTALLGSAFTSIGNSFIGGRLGLSGFRPPAPITAPVKTTPITVTVNQTITGSNQSIAGAVSRTTREALQSPTTWAPLQSQLAGP